MSTISEGDDVLAAIRDVPGPEAAWMAAVGTLEGVELVVSRGDREESFRVAGRVTLVSLSGPKRGPLHVVVARGDEGGATLFAGKLVRARSLGVEVGIVGTAVSGDEPAPAPSPDAAAPVKAAGQPAPPSAAASGWAALAAVKPAEDPDEESDELPKYGDRVDHGVFGLCDVMVVRGDRMKIRDVHGTGRMREVHVGAFKILRPVVRDGKRVFKLAKRG